VVRFAWLVPALPAASFFVILFFGKRLPRKGAEVGIAAVAISWVLSIVILWHFVQDGEPVARWVQWFEAGSFFKLQVGTFVDGLSAIMLIVVTTVSLLVQVYSTAYMHGDRRYTFFFASLSLFTAAMLDVVVAYNLFQLLVGWELMGICSYLLIGHWWEEKVNSDAAIKAFITTRIGDVPFMFGIFVLTIAAGTSNIPAINEMAQAHQLSTAILTAGAFLLFSGVIGKSAQLPLYVWLPDAMAGPTPVSALIHAATMVAAGVFLIARLFPVFLNAGHVVLVFIGAIAAVTMLMSALLAMIQDDIKRVLAYSTVSQLAYMVLGLSLGGEGYTVGIFHLFTHAFFKALLFLGAGSIIHAVHTNNMSEMGGLRKFMPITFWTFLIGSAALAGIPPFAGFWSKDEIISLAYHSHHYALWAVALATAVITAFYMTRAVLLTFFGQYRGVAAAGHGQEHGHATAPHESPLAITVPLMILAAGSVGVGFLNAAAFGVHVFGEWVHVGTEFTPEAFNYGFAAISIVGALAGIAVGYRLYARWQERDPVRRLGRAYVLLENKYHLDTLYMRGIIRPIQYPLAQAVYWTNQHILDGAVNGAAWLTRRVAGAFNIFDERVVDGAVDGVGLGTRWIGREARYMQSGNVQLYAAVLFGGVTILALAITRHYLVAGIAAGAFAAILITWFFTGGRVRSEETT
jgi:NADH-quinone oxidoreductase subunit L